jgi:hypothetical protein
VRICKYINENTGCFCFSLWKLDEVEVVEGHLVAITPKNEHETEFIDTGRVTVAGLGFPISLKACNTCAV